MMFRKNPCLVCAAVAALSVASLFADVTRDGTTVFSRDTGIMPPAGDFTALVTFRHKGYAPVPKDMEWRNGMVMCYRSGYFDGWRVHLHDNVEMRPVFEIGRTQGSVGLDGGFPVAKDAWHRLAASWQHGADPKVGVMRLWLDGRLLAESPADRPAPKTDDSTLKLGYVDFGVGALNLEVRDVAVLPKALGADEIARDFTSAVNAKAMDPHASHPLLMQVYDRAMTRIAGDDWRPKRVAPKPIRVIELGPGRQTVNATRCFEGPEHDGLLIRGASDGSTVLSGAEEIPASSFRAPTDEQLLSRFPEAVRTQVIAAEVKGLESLRAFGVGVRHRDGILLATPGGRLLRQARWPQAGCAAATNCNGSIRFLGSAPQLAPGTKFLAHGYWKYFWADAALPAETAADGSFALLESHSYGLSEAPSAAIAGVPEVTDRPGEWCLVGETLCLIPPEDFTGVRVPRLTGPFFEFKKVRNVRLENVTLEGAVGSAVKAQHCEGLSLVKVGISAVGGDGAVLDGCDGAFVSDCRFARTGHNALTLSGGDRRTLRAGNMRVEGCRFTTSGQLTRTYTPGVLLQGCGGILSGCVFEDLPSSAIRLEGNDHLIRDCTFTRTVLESDDQGAIDIWGDPTYRGNIYYRNRFARVGGDDNNACGRGAIRFDDMISGQAVIGNVFEDCSQGNFGAIQMNGGSYNAVVSNVFRSCAKGVTVGRWDDARFDERLKTQEFVEKMRISRENDVYLQRYPELGRVGRDHGVELILDNDFGILTKPVSGLSASGLFR